MTPGMRKQVKKTTMRCVSNEFVFNDNAKSTLQNDGTTLTIHLLQRDSSGSSSNDDDDDESGPEEELDAEVTLKCKEEMRQRCVTDRNDEFNIAERVMGWEMSSKFSTEPSRLEPVHHADNVDSNTANTLHWLSPYEDILVACGEDVLPAQVVMTTSFGILVKYYTSYKINATDLRYKIVGQTTPYEVDYTEFIGKLDRLVKREYISNPRLQDINVMFSNWPCAKILSFLRRTISNAEESCCYVRSSVSFYYFIIVIISGGQRHGANSPSTTKKSNVLC